jgi:hypothetical protein
MHLDKQFVLDELRKHADDAHVQKAIAELPDKIDHEAHAELLLKHGIDPGKLAEKAAQRGIADLTK